MGESPPGQGPLQGDNAVAVAPRASQEVGKARFPFVGQMNKAGAWHLQFQPEGWPGAPLPECPGTEQWMVELWACGGKDRLGERRPVQLWLGALRAAPPAGVPGVHAGQQRAPCEGLSG